MPDWIQGLIFIFFGLWLYICVWRLEVHNRCEVHRLQNQLIEEYDRGYRQGVRDSRKLHGL